MPTPITPSLHFQAELDVDPVRDREGSQLAAGDAEEEGTDDQFVDEQLEEREGRLRGGFDEEDEEVDSRLYGLERVGGDGDERPTINMKSYQRQDDMDPAELLLFAKDSFMK
ncbi:MAG: hypothetical protein WDW36_009385 [Sanguina aurantia]